MNWLNKKYGSLKRKIAKHKVINTDKLYQYWEQEHLIKVFREYDVDCVFDVGANVGQYAGMLRKKVGFKGLILSFEPIPEAAQMLRQKAESDPNWVVIETALSSKNGSTNFNVMSASQFSSLSAPRHDETDKFSSSNVVEQAIEVTTETLERATERLQQQFAFNSPFLKLDTQGFDVEIVRACPEATLRKFVGMQSELAVKKLYAHSVNFSEALDQYEQKGFTLSAFVPNNEGHFPLLVETDCIMIRNELVDA